eukprot:2415026-Amphidinium_carterae.1
MSLSHPDSVLCLCLKEKGRVSRRASHLRLKSHAVHACLRFGKIEWKFATLELAGHRAVRASGLLGEHWEFKAFCRHSNLTGGDWKEDQ